MREIRFRGKRIDNGEWVYGGYYHGIMAETNNPFSIDNARIKTVIIQDAVYYHVDLETVSEYTGLHDKNGKEDYEGNLLKDLYTGLVCVVKYGSFTSQNGNGTGFYLEKLDGKVYIPYPCNLDCWTIIGNIHEATNG